MLTYFQFYSGICQQLDNFKPLQSQGKIPQDLFNYHPKNI